MNGQALYRAAQARQLLQHCNKQPLDQLPLAATMSVVEEEAGAAGAGVVNCTSKSAGSYCERPEGLITAGSSVKVQIYACI